MGWTAADIPDLTGKTAIVTGGNGGLGLETTRELARKGAQVVIAARNLDKAADAAADVRSGIDAAALEVRGLDLASRASIEDFAAGMSSTRESTDILFNNAGVMAVPQRETEDGFELQFGTNHLGHFYLTNLLLPLLLKAARGRVVTTTSTARFAAGKYDLTNAHSRNDYDPWTAYGISKRANLHFAIELNNRLAAAGSTMTSYAADPGFSDTDLQATSARESGGRTQRFFEKWTPRVGQSAARGALPQLQAGTDPEAVGGSLYRPNWVIRGDSVRGGIGARLRKPEDLRDLWAVSERDLRITFDVAAMVAQTE